MDFQIAASGSARSADQYVVFKLGETIFGVSIDQVMRVVPFVPATRVPRAPEFLEGVINDHSQVVPVVDLKKRLKLSDGTGYGRRSRILVVALDSQPIGMLVDAVVGVSRFPQDSIGAPPPMVAEVNGIYLAGMARTADRLVVLLDLSRVLSVEEAGQLDGWRAGDAT